MSSLARVKRVIFCGAISFLLTANLIGPAQGQSSQPLNSYGDGTASQTEPDNSNSVDPGDFENLIEAVDKDIGQLGQVKVGQTGSASLDQPVSSVERQTSTVGKTPAAVFVITNEMIHRSGAVCIPDVLRMVPGIQVAQISSSEWAISSRGMNYLRTHELLVQIDGRTVYDLFSGGVIWDVQDVILEDVERIEVVRGPGATVWGANAVNGVINIITKRAQDTQGVLLQGGAGSHELGYTNGRYGGRIGQDINYRVYGKWFDRGASNITNSVSGSSTVDPGSDAWNQSRGGFRMDYKAGESDEMTLQGDCYDGQSTAFEATCIPTSPYYVLNNKIDVSGENILYRWKHTIDDDTDWAFQSYFDRTNRYYQNPAFGYSVNIMDLDFQHRFPLGSRNEVIWGCGYRYVEDVFQNNAFYFNVYPESRADNYLSYFAQDQITLIDDKWFFIAGSKFEHNNYTNFEYQPTARLLWTPSDRHSIWGAISRAVHTPTRQTDDAWIRQFPPMGSSTSFPTTIGNRGLESEDLLAYELGLRVQATKKFSWDLALFYNQYDNISSYTTGTPYTDAWGYTIVPLTYSNGASGETYGAELAANYAVTERWRMQLSYTYTRLFLHTDLGQLEYINMADTPYNQAYLQSSWDIGEHWQFDFIERYVDCLPASNKDTMNYIVTDLRLAWHKSDRFEVSVVGRNLGNGYYNEFCLGPYSGRKVAKVGPQVYTQLTWRY